MINVRFFLVWLLAPNGKCATVRTRVAHTTRGSAPTGGAVWSSPTRRRGRDFAIYNYILMNSQHARLRIQRTLWTPWAQGRTRGHKGGHVGPPLQKACPKERARDTALADEQFIFVMNRTNENYWLLLLPDNNRVAAVGGHAVWLKCVGAKRYRCMVFQGGGTAR